MNIWFRDHRAKSAELNYFWGQKLESIGRFAGAMEEYLEAAALCESLALDVPPMEYPNTKRDFESAARFSFDHAMRMEEMTHPVKT